MELSDQVEPMADIRQSICIRARRERVFPLIASGRSSDPWTAGWTCQTGQEWTGTSLLFELTETSGKTQLRFTHADWEAETECFVSCTKVWEELLARLKAAAEGESPGPLFSTDRLAS
jgi:hypothetical protein